MACSSASPPSLAWEWILEHVLDIKDIGTPILKEIMTYISDVEKNSGLQKRIALRYLEEILALGKIDAQAIPLVAVLTKDCRETEAQHKPALATSSSSSDLLLRVQTEAILASVREVPRNWQEFGQALDHILPEKSDDARVVERRKELRTVWQSENQEKRCLEILKTYSVDALQHDLFKYTTLEKAYLEQTFLCQLLHDVLKGQYPLSESVVMKAFLKEYSKTDPCGGELQANSVGSDDPTVFCDRSLDEVDCDSVKNTQRASLSFERGFDMQLRERHQDGKAVTSHSPLKSVENCNERLPAKDMGNKRIKTAAMDVKTNSVGEDFLDLGSDGNEELCHKCRKGGKLLCCDGCPIAVHARCLGSNSSTLIEQDWFCPICVQMQAAEAVARAQQKERDAKERLAAFMEGLGDTNSKETLGRSSVHLCAQPEKASRKNNAADCGMRACETDSKKRGDTEIRSSEAKEAAQAADSESNKGIERETGDHNVIKDNSNRLVPVPDGAAIQTSDANAFLSKAKEPIYTSQAQVQEEDGDGHDGDLEEGSDDKKADDLNIGRQSSKRKRDVKFQRSDNEREKDCPHAMRRKRLLWSKEENDILKEGVKKYSHDNGSWGFQWGRILEFGQGKFHPSRTTVDLKDKWRNLAKSYM